MPPYHDVYVLANERSTATAARFLDNFLPNRQQSAASYEFPRYAEQPALLFESAMDAMRYCEDHPAEAQAFYFHSHGAAPTHAMVFFTSDGAMIVGLSVTSSENEWLARLRGLMNSDAGYIVFECPPVATAAEFRDVVRRQATQS